MKKHLLPSILALLFVLFPSIINAQSTFIYEKGKSYNGIDTYVMPQTICLDGKTKSVVVSNGVPDNKTTICYRVKIPSYVKGAFFARDSKPGDYEWPNNTNRFLPWMFSKLSDLTSAEYQGIPSNGKPSTLGDALLLQQADGSAIFAKAVSSSNSISWFQVNADGTLLLYVSTLGHNKLEKKAPIVLVQKKQDVYQTLRKAYEVLIANHKISSLKKRGDKRYFEAFEYLGWCTWEHYHFDIDEVKILNDLDAIEHSPIPVRYVLIDDGHLANKNKQLTSFKPNKNKFPNGWTSIMAHKKNDKIRWIGLWYALSGYWMGVSPQNDFPNNIKNSLYSLHGALLPGKSNKNINLFYQYYVSSLKRQGFDFLKVDNQSFTLPLYMGSTDVVRQAKECNLALEKQTHIQNVGLMNCMAQNIINTDHTTYSSVARVSIDYKKYDEDMAKSHLFQSYTNTLLQGQSVWPDHDMFHSCDTICGSLMARSKAISGGPVYLSDSPKDFIAENIFPLIDTKGKIFRPLAPAVPTPESIFINPLRDGKPYRVFAPTGDEAVSIICYNLNTSLNFKTVTATIGKDDYYLRENFMDKPKATKANRILLYSWNDQTATELTSNYSITLEGFSDKLFHLCPIKNGWAVVGIQEKYLSPSTVEILSSSPDKITLNVLCPGTLKVWAENATKKEIRTIVIKTPQRITLRK